MIGHELQAVQDAVYQLDHGQPVAALGILRTILPRRAQTPEPPLSPIRVHRLNTGCPGPYTEDGHCHTCGKGVA